MSSLLRPMHRHERWYWVLPDTRLGRWTAVIFLAAVLLLLSFPLATPLLERLTGASRFDTLFATPVPYTMILGAASSLLAIVALTRGHAVALLVPAVLGTLSGVLLVGMIVAGD